MEQSKFTFGNYTSEQPGLESRIDPSKSLQQCKISTRQYLQSITGLSDPKIKISICVSYLRTNLLQIYKSHQVWYNKRSTIPQSETLSISTLALSSSSCKF